MYLPVGIAINFLPTDFQRVGIFGWYAEAKDLAQMYLFLLAVLRGHENWGKDENDDQIAA